MRKLNGNKLLKVILFIFIAYYIIGTVATTYYDYTHQNHMLCVPPKGISIIDPNYKCPTKHDSFIIIARNDVISPYFWMLIPIWPLVWQGVE